METDATLIFQRNHKSMEAEAWIKQIHKIFKALKCSEKQKVPFATFMFKGEANYWWEMIERILENNEDKFIFWETFLEVFYEKYFSMSIRHQKEA